MLRYIAKRLLIAIPVLIGISIIVFALVMSTPGDPYSGMLSPGLSAEYKEAKLRELGFYDPMPVQYFKWVGRALQGDFGYSTTYNRAVMEVIGEVFGNTVLLAAVSLLLSMLLGIPIGVYVSTHKNGIVDHAMSIFSFIGLSIPAFFFALLLVRQFGYIWKLLPVSGMITTGVNYTGWEHVADVANHIIMPALVLSLLNMASFMRHTRSAMLDVISQDFIRTARAKGVPRHRITWRHAFKNALIPIITVISLQIPSLLSGALLTETVFVWPGIGRLNWQAVQNRDYPLIMGIVMILATITLIANLVADICYAVVDPRIRY